MVFHVELGLMPLFHGISPEITAEVPPERLPLRAMVLIAFAASDPAHARRWGPWRAVHFWISIVYSITNVPHLIADITVPDARSDQIVLMAALVLIGLMINLEAWRWWREGLAVPT